MGLFSKQKTVGELEEEKDRLTVEEEVYTKRAEIAERKAVIAELEKKYGSGWAKILGVNKLTSLSTLRSFLVSAKQGLSKQASTVTNTPLNPTRQMEGFRGIKRA